MFLLVLAHLDSPGQRVVKQLCLCVLTGFGKEDDLLYKLVKSATHVTSSGSLFQFPVTLFKKQCC